MILSWRHRFVFIKGRKVGGTSVECVLSEACGEEDIVTPITRRDEAVRVALGSGARNYSDDPAGERAYLEAVARSEGDELAAVRPPERIYYHHMPLCEVVAAAGPEVLALPVICAERHPYAKVVSWANHQLTWSEYARGGDLRAAGDHVRSFLEAAVDSGLVAEVRNIELYRRPTGDVDVRVLRTEHLQDDFDAFLASLGLPGMQLPFLKRSVEAHAEDIRDFLSPRRLSFVNRLFAEEFERFGYEPV